MITASVVAAALLTTSAASERLLRVETSPLVMEFLEDPESHVLCGGRSVVPFVLRSLARVTLRVEGVVVEAEVDGKPTVSVQDVSLAAGRHEVVLRRPAWASAPVMSAKLEIEARVEGAAAETASAELVPDVRNPAVFRVGRTVLSGVDMLEGHLTVQATDIKLPGRNVVLEAARTYSSAARGLRGVAGVGWGLSYLTGVASRPECGLYAVMMYDGSSQTFRSADGRTFTPQRGYHTTLSLGADGSLVFEDKAGTRHTYAVAPNRWSIHPLLYLEEPHGDRISLRYDPGGRVLEIAEGQRQGRAAYVIPRLFRLGYTTAGGYDRIAWLDAPGLGLRLEYEYDAGGQLIRTTRRDEEAARPAIDLYSYEKQKPQDRLGLTKAVFADGRVDTYQYRGGRVAEVCEKSAKGETTTTTFSYVPPAGNGLATTILGPGSARYLLNADGNPVEIDEPDGTRRKISKMEWNSVDMVKISESNNQGHRWEWGYDTRGNLTSEAHWTADSAVPETTTYAYALRFNKLSYRCDIKGKISRWTLDPATGDLVDETDAEGKTTRYRHDAQGRLTEKLDSQGRRTRYLDHDSFGYHTRMVEPDGTTKRFEYDLRGRVIKD
jgi:YD repeat-containing protein